MTGVDLVTWLLAVLDEDQALLGYTMPLSTPGVYEWELEDVRTKREIVNLCGDPLLDGTQLTALKKKVTRLVAFPYSGRPGYREEWRP